MDAQIEEMVEKINECVSKHIFFELAIYSYNYKSDQLIIAGSEDFTYFHTYEIIFSGVYTIVGNTHWRVDTKRPALEIASPNEAYEINKKHGIESGNTLFKFFDEYEEGDLYIAARSINFRRNIVKYYE